ncbi:hypothetical protein OQA88_6208 [Cercophora sp. LCS_1]
MGAASAILIVLITILCPFHSLLSVCTWLPAAVRISSSTSASRSLGRRTRFLCGNGQVLTLIARVFPGHLHAFYVEYVYFDRREQVKNGGPFPSRAPGVYSERVQTGGYGYGTVVQPTPGY